MPNNVRHPRPGVRIPRCARNDKGWLLLSILGGALLMASCGGSAAVPAASSAAASSRSAAPVASATASAAAKPSAAGETTKLNVAYSNPTPIITPAWVARDAGIFNKNGLDVNLLLIAGGAVTTAALVSGQIDFALAGGSEALSAAAGGADLVIVGTQVPVWPFVLIAAPEIKTVGDLKGKKVAIVTNGGSVDIAMRAALPKLGVTPDTDFTVIATGSSPNIVTALLSGAVQAGMVGTPDNVLLQEKGFRALLDLATSKIPGATSGIVAQRAHVAAHKEATQKLVDSLVEGTVKVHKDKAFAIATLKKELKSEDDRAMGIAYDFYIGSGAMPVLPYPKPEQFADAQNVLGAKNENIRKVDLGKLLDDSFVKSAAQRGLDR